MAKTSGGVRGATGKRGGLNPGDANFRGKLSNPKSLSNIRDISLYRDVTSAISRYHSVLGVRQREIGLAELGSGVGGVHVTRNGESHGIYLNSMVFENGTSKTVADWAKKGYKSGYLTKTNKPVAHIVTHELAHSTWNSNFKGAKYKGAGKEVEKLYRTWRKDTKKTGYGSYAKVNVNEFWAEVITKSVIGKGDEYTRKAKSIVKKYKL